MPMEAVWSAPIRSHDHYRLFRLLLACAIAATVILIKLTSSDNSMSATAATTRREQRDSAGHLDDDLGRRCSDAVDNLVRRECASSVPAFLHQSISPSSPPSPSVPRSK